MALASEPLEPAGASESDADLLGAFIRGVSHDMRSPLLTLSLSAEMLADVVLADERSRLAREALTEGIVELERLLDAVSAISRARSRILATEPARLRDLLDGYIVIGDGADARIAIDPRSVVEAIAALADTQAEIVLTMGAGHVELSLPLPEVVADLSGDPLRALLTSLQQYAGTAIATLAASQVLLERQGGAIRCEDGRAVLTLPFAGA